MCQELIDVFEKVADLRPEEREEFYVTRGVPAAVRDGVESLLRFDKGPDSVAGVIAHAAQAMLVNAHEAGPQPATCGPYRIVRPLGTGGMGEVYLGERADGEVQQRVAIKVARSSPDLPA